MVACNTTVVCNIATYQRHIQECVLQANPYHHKAVYYIWVEFLHYLLAAHTLINCISRAMVHEYANLEVM